MVVHVHDTYYMFAEGEQDHAQWLTSTDGVGLDATGDARHSQ